MPLMVETADKVPLNIPEELLMTETTMSGGTSIGLSAGAGISVCVSSRSSLLQTHLHEHLSNQPYLISVADVMDIMSQIPRV